MILRLHRHSGTTGQLGRTGRSKQIGALEIDPLVASASSCDVSGSQKAPASALGGDTVIFSRRYVRHLGQNAKIN